MRPVAPARRSGPRAVPRRRFTGWFLVLALLCGLGLSAPGAQATPTTNPASVWWEAYPNLPLYPDNSTNPGKRVIDIGIHSPSTDNMTVKWVRVLLPKNWSKTANRTWPTLWMLHGGGGDHTSYTTDTHIEEMVADEDVMVVMPETSKCSSYTNWWNYDDESQPPNWEDYVVDEVSQILESQYRASGERSVLGISMGGGGAMMLAGKHPGHFKAVASISGAVNMLHYDAEEAIQGPSVVKAGALQCGVDWKRINGEPGYPFYTNVQSDEREKQRWIDNSALGVAEGLRGTPLFVSFGNGNTVDPGWVWNGAQTATPSPGRCQATAPPKGFDGVGSFVERAIRGQNHDFVNELAARGIAATVCMTYGQHEWQYWEREVYAALPMLLDAIDA
ncbi:alpha/beta hydrolase [Streptodolium elevatio]|uniref:Alpha/beta fold hydrolase n=1 Tax=Streptodolium elevatio TaxID=3157996 RepID=A0ABV3DQA0_9ACTN